jgi:methyl-accepting chemotaxis protein
MADGRFYGMLCVDTRADWYAELINRSAAELGEGAFCAVIDREGKYVLHPDLKKVKSGANLFADDIVPSGEADTASAPEIRQRRDLKIDKVLLKSGNAGIPHFMILAPLDTGKDYSLAVFLPEETLTGPIRKRLSLGLAMMLAATILAAAVAVVILHFVLTPLRQSIQTAERIARGDLELVAKMSRFREFNTLFDAFNRMILAIRSRTAAMETSIADLDGILRQVAALSQELLRVASNVSAHSQELSAGATEQSSVFQEISKAASRLEAHARSNAELAGNTNRIIEQVERTATDGNQRMRQLSEAMQEISGITESINTALKAIDVIAFQTNILALNAAVEAARAGSHGRGFNVVASEVRQLANRSAQSVVSTTETLRESAAKVQVGLDMGEKTMTALEEIERIATDAAQLMRKVTEQAADQSRIISEVLAGLEQVMEVAKRNVDSASTNAAVSEKLLSLSSQISVFLSKTHRIPSENRDDKATPHPDPNQPAANTRRRE